MRSLILATACLLPLFSGCVTLPDALFAVFGSAYSGGGPSSADRQRDYDQRVEASRAYADANRE